MTDDEGQPSLGALSEVAWQPISVPEPVVRPPRQRNWLLWISSGLIVTGLCLGAMLVFVNSRALPIALAEGSSSLAKGNSTDQGGQMVDEKAPQILDPIEVKTSKQSMIDQAWIRDTAMRTQIPMRALSAYAEAAARVTHEYPGCGLGWNTLAGIGEVESHHGTIGGSTIGPDGKALPSIIGVQLDGNGVAYIPDTDQGMLDGDTMWDRAVGPMQFIPSTWQVWGADGSGDGKADPQNIDDAAWSAARYLCESGGDLTVAENWIAAVAAYNDSVEYNNQVAAAASLYAELVQESE